jgi:pyruvate dehydrogenase E2 component (dihydrolipoamide acetyltransferase)
MATPVIMPKFGMAQEEGTIIRWLKQAGERVEKGETILEVQTDKIDMEVEAPASGVLTDVRYGADAIVPVTTVIAMIAALGEALTPLAAPAAPAASAPPIAPAEVRVSPVAQRMAVAVGVDLTQITGSGPSGRITKRDVANALAEAEETVKGTAKETEFLQETRFLRATPAARRLAREHNIDLALISGSGPQGRIQAVDVERGARSEGRGAASAAPSSVVEPPSDGRGEMIAGEPLRGKRRTIASRLSQSWQSAPHVFFTTSIDLARVDALTVDLAGEVEAGGGRLTPTVWIARAVATALQRHPRLNAWLQPGGDQLLYTQHQDVHLGIAVAVNDGLLVPVVQHAGGLGLAALAARIDDLSARARAGQLTPDEVSGGTFTLSNLGMYPVEHFTAIINPPEVAILAVGRAQMQPVWNGVAFEPRRLLQATLSADHRAIDGAVAAAFLAELKRLLEEPARLLL